MTLEEVQALLKTLQTDLTQSFQTYIDTKLAPVEAQLVTLSKPPDPVEVPETSNPNLDARVKDLEKQLADATAKSEEQAKREASLNFDRELSKVMDSYPVQFKDVAFEVVSNRIKSEAANTNGEWVTKDGKKLSEYVKEFTNSDFGKHLLPSNHTDGLGNKQPKGKAPEVEANPEEALWQAFRN